MEKCAVRKCFTSKSFYVFAIASFLFFNFSCSKQDVVEQRSNAIDSNTIQINYVAKIKNSLHDSLTANDFSSVDFSKVFKSKDVRSKNYFLRLTFKGKKIADDFLLLKTDSVGNIINAKIVHVQRNNNGKISADIILVTSSLNRKSISYVQNVQKKSNSESANANSDAISSSNVSSLMMEQEGAVGEQTLPDVVVVGYTYNYSYTTYWYLYDGIFGGGGAVLEIHIPTVRIVMVAEVVAMKMTIFITITRLILAMKLMTTLQ